MRGGYIKPIEELIELYLEYGSVVKEFMSENELKRLRAFRDTYRLITKYPLMSQTSISKKVDIGPLTVGAYKEVIAELQAKGKLK